MWFQKQFTLPAKSRGSYLITDTVLQELPQIKQYKVGLLNLFIQHTSCALSLNENWDSVCTIMSEGEGVAGSTSFLIHQIYRDIFYTTATTNFEMLMDMKPHKRP